MVTMLLEGAQALLPPVPELQLPVYDIKGRVDYVEDPAQNRTTYIYNPDTGQKVVEEKADGKYTRYQYNDNRLGVGPS